MSDALAWMSVGDLVFSWPFKVVGVAVGEFVEVDVDDAGAFPSSVP
jgi:hypothetical protein